MPPKLLAGERPIAIARQHWSTVAPTVSVGVALLVAGLVALGATPGNLGGASTTDIKHVLATVLVLADLLVVGARVLQWRFSVYMLTDHRIVVSRGVVSRVTESIGLDRIQDTVVRQSLAGRMINCGDVEIESAGRDGTEVLHRIPNPEGFYNAIMQATEAHRLGPMAVAAATSAAAVLPPSPPV